MTDDHYAAAVEPGRSTDYRRVVSKVLVAVQLYEIGEYVIDVVQRMRPVGVSGQLDPVPRAERRKHLQGTLLKLVFQLGQALGARAAGSAGLPDFLDFAAELVQVFLERENSHLSPGGGYGRLDLDLYVFKTVESVRPLVMPQKKYRTV